MELPHPLPSPLSCFLDCLQAFCAPETTFFPVPFRPFRSSLLDPPIMQTRILVRARTPRLPKPSVQASDNSATRPDGIPFS